MGSELHRHLQALLITIFVVGGLGLSYYWYYNVPVNVYDIKVIDTNIALQDKLTVSYRIAEQHKCAQATLIASIDDGIEVVRVYRANLFTSSISQFDNLIHKDIGVPGFAAPGKARLSLQVEYVCHRLHVWSPLIIHLGTYSFTVVDKIGEERNTEKDRQISRLHAEIYGLNIRVHNLFSEVQNLRNNMARKGKMNDDDDDDRIIIRPSERKLRARAKQGPSIKNVMAVPEVPTPLWVQVPAEATPKTDKLNTTYDPVGDFFKRQLTAFE